MPLNYGFRNLDGELVPLAQVDNEMREETGMPADPKEFSYLYESSIWFAMAVAALRDGPLQIEWCDDYWNEKGRDAGEPKRWVEANDDRFSLDISVREFAFRWLCGGKYQFELLGRSI